MKANEKCRKIGERVGRNAARWWEQDSVGGRVSRSGDAIATARAVLEGLEDGDPAVLDCLPFLDLSGQWADGATDASVLEECGYDAERMLERDPDTASERIEAYREGYDAGVVLEVERACRSVLEGVEVRS